MYTLVPILVVVCLALFAGGSPQGVGEDLTIDDISPIKPHTGKSATEIEWSHDDRYVAFRWNGYDDKGYDLWVYDTKDKKLVRLTSLETFMPFDRDIPGIKERYEKEKAEAVRRRSLKKEERYKLDEEDEKKREKEEEERRKKGEKAPPEYAGVTSYAWAHKSHELLLTYKGDIYRMTLEEKKPIRITDTLESESDIRYTKDDSGFFFRRGNNVFRMHFDSPNVTQLNPELPKGLQLGWYNISPDESKMMIGSTKTAGQSREVDYITYRDRFAQARKTQRDVADDTFKSESYLFIYDVNDDPGQNPKHDGKPWEIYYWPSGEEYGQTSIHEEPWSADSKRFVFATWERDKRALEVRVADIETKKVETVYSDKHTLGHSTPGMTRPFFTPDGRKIVCLLEKSGYRHAWIIDPMVKGATQLTRGDFEVYPQVLSEDGATLYATSWKEHPSRMDAYAVSMADGTMTRMTAKVGAYGSFEFSHNKKKIAASFKNWSEQAELYVCEGGKEDKVTDSHPGTFAEVAKIQPELFEFKNRAGYTIHGYLYRPPGWKKEDKRPLLIYTYGGPLGTSKDVVQGNWNMFNMYMAYKHGYVTAVIDPRGMSGYAGVFEAANWEQPGKPQVEDLSDGARYLISELGCDPQKVGIYGWSFGGFQTQMCLYTAPDVFTLGIAGAGPTEWQNYNNWYSGGVIGDAGPGKADDLDKFSLTKLAEKLQSPLMLLHGVEDTNVLFQDTVKVYQALLRAGKGPLVELVIDPTGGHGLGGDIKRKEQYRIYESFLLRRWGAWKKQ